MEAYQRSRPFQLATFTTCIYGLEGLWKPKANDFPKTGMLIFILFLIYSELSSWLASSAHWEEILSAWIKRPGETAVARDSSISCRFFMVTNQLHKTPFSLVLIFRELALADL